MNKMFYLLILLFSFDFSSGHCKEFGKWIRVKDDLPKVNKLYLIYTEKLEDLVDKNETDYRIMLQYFYPEYQMFSSEYAHHKSGLLYLKVTHWMELPSLPKD